MIGVSMVKIGTSIIEKIGKDNEKIGTPMN
jgi:hypothetical protein